MRRELFLESIALKLGRARGSPPTDRTVRGVSDAYRASPLGAGKQEPRGSCRLVIGREIGHLELVVAAAGARLGLLGLPGGVQVG